MKRLLTIILLILPFSIHASYTPTSLLELLNYSEYIVEYKITKVMQYHIEISITESYKGIKSEKLTINKFTNWACAQRQSKYKTGQSGIMFIQTNSNSNRLEIMGAGNEGDMIYENGIVTWAGKYTKDNNNDSKYVPDKYDTIDVKNAIIEYFKNKKELELRIRNKKIKGYITKNPFMKCIINSMMIDINKREKETD